MKQFTQLHTYSTVHLQKWENKKSNLKRIKLFGCNAYAKVLESLKKLDERSRKYTFVEYSPNGYRLWDKERDKEGIKKDNNYKGCRI